MSAVITVLRKDLRLELRTFETLPAMALFSVATFVIFHFGLNRATIDGQLAGGVFTVTLLFAALLGAGRLFVAEREQGGFDAFLLAPVDRNSLLLAKATAMFLFLAVLELVAVPAFALLLLGPPGGAQAARADRRPGPGGPGPGRDRHVRLGAGDPHPGPGSDRADRRPAAADSGADRHRAGRRSAAREPLHGIAARQMAGDPRSL